MIKTISILFTISIFASLAIPELEPTLGKLVDKSPEGEIEFIKQGQACESIWEKVSDPSDYEMLSKEEKFLYDNCDETESYWDILGIGCSWYCGGGQDTSSASSSLKSVKGISYESKNAHDLSYKTAWIEGVDGYGVGEYLTYHFPPENPRITKIIIVNGYVKSDKSWRENSRVKRLKMYLNDEPFAILKLANSRQEQEFTFEPIGESDRENLGDLIGQPWWTMKFEILEVYKGDKYEDTAISQIYFDGIDVH